MTVLRYLRAAQRCSLDEFQCSHPDPVFLVLPYDEAEASYETRCVSGGPGSETSVVPIRKQEGLNPFTMMVTLGRAPNNDIVIDAPDISKFHAYVVRGASGFSLADAGSTFGTRLRGQTLVRMVGVPLENGDEVLLGGVKLLYFTPAGLYHHLRDEESVVSSS